MGWFYQKPKLKIGKFEVWHWRYKWWEVSILWGDWPIFTTNNRLAVLGWRVRSGCGYLCCVNRDGWQRLIYYADVFGWRIEYGTRWSLPANTWWHLPKPPTRWPRLWIRKIFWK